VSTRKLGSFGTVGKGNPVVPIDIVPLKTIAPPMNQKWDQPAKATQQNVEVDLPHDRFP